MKAPQDVVLQVSGLRVAATSDSREILGGVSLSIERGKMLGLVGESGSGKTTVGLACLGYLRRGTTVTAGTITVNGESVLERTAAQMRGVRAQSIAYVPQSAGYSLDPSMRVGRQLGQRIPQIAGSQASARLLDAMEEVALPRTTDFLRRYPHELSGGQQQRLLIAAAFIAEPDVVILDEPTTGLDVTTQATILAMVRRISEDHGTAALFVTHDLGAVAEVTSEVCVMYAGEIVEEGPTREVLLHPAHGYTERLRRAVPRLWPSSSDTTLVERRPVTAQVTTEATSATTAIAVAGLTARHGTKDILHDLNVTFGAGRTTAVVGESGSGKTTLCRTLIGLHTTYSGQVTMAGELLAHSSRGRTREQRRRMQYIFQNAYDALNPRRTVAELVTQPLRVFGERWQKGFVERQLELVSLPATMASRFPEELSGGERQRVALARALTARPEILICDEVTSALDVSVQATVVQLISRIQEQMDLTVLFVTHDLALVREIADDVVVLNEGLVVDSGAVDSVFEAPSSSYTQDLLGRSPDLWKQLEQWRAGAAL